MKFLLASLIVVAFISSSFVTAQLMGNDTSSCPIPTNGTVTMVCQIGQKGVQGGLKGDTGPPGPQGEPGMMGCEGLSVNCERGPPGEKGGRGARGRRGVRGKQGAKGEQGDKGEPGVGGMKGDLGVKGEKGLQGTPGGFIVNLTEAQYKQLKKELYQEFEEKLLKCALPTPSTHQSLQCSGSSMDISNPPILPTTSQQISQSSGLEQATVVSSQPSNLITTSTDQPTFTPQPTPSPLHCAGTTVNKPATSCKEIYNCTPTAPSGYYWISTTEEPLQVYCQMESNAFGGIAGGWMRAAYIDPAENKTCPEGLIYTNVSYTSENMCPSEYKELCTNFTTKHMCIRSHTDKYNCSSVKFKTHGVLYSTVSGRAHGYQFRYTPAFRGYHYDGDGFLSNGQTTLDDSYVSGLSVTYGSPRKHIWTFAAGWSKDHDYETTNCPCAQHPGPPVPPFVGKNYFCESGNKGRVEGSGLRWHFKDPLWDSQGCITERNCCDRGGPWFNTAVKETSDDIEVRMCHYFDYRTENIGVELLEIFIY